MGNVTLIGMPGSGKSTVGVLLAKFLGYGFLDVDLLIQQQQGALLQEILDRRGVAAFLDAEEQAVLGLRCDGHVIAPGGSAVCRERAALHLKELGPVVYLRVELEELQRRFHSGCVDMEGPNFLEEAALCSESLLEKVFYSNLMRVVNEVCSM